jgi:hypothetical protein
VLAAIAPRDVAVWERYAHERLICVTESNEVLTKAQLIDQLEPLPIGLIGHLHVGTMKVERHGNIAIATHVDDERLDYPGQLIDRKAERTTASMRGACAWFRDRISKRCE